MEYDSSGKLIFEGVYKNGIKWNGKGKEFDSDDKLILKQNIQMEKKNEIEYHSDFDSDN